LKHAKTLCALDFELSKYNIHMENSDCFLKAKKKKNDREIKSQKLKFINIRINSLQGDLSQCHTSTHESIPASPPKIRHMYGPKQNNPMLGSRSKHSHKQITQCFNRKIFSHNKGWVIVDWYH